MFQTVYLSIIMTLALYTAIGMCHTGFADCLLVGSGCQQNLYDTYLLLCTVLES